MAQNLGMKISGFDFNLPSSLSVNTSIRNLFIQQVPRTPLKYGFAAWEKIILNMRRHTYTWKALGEFAELRKATINFAMSVRQST